MSDIHREAEEIIEEKEQEEVDADCELECLLDLQWVIDVARHHVVEHDHSDAESTRLIELVLTATERKMEILGL